MQPKFPNKAALTEALESNLAWIIKSIDAQSGKGSSAYRWAWGVWGDSYPETTGYLIPTLLNADKHLPSLMLSKSAIKLSNFLISIQNDDGSFPVTPGSDKKNVFDTSQILLGLCYYHKNNVETKILNSIEKAFNWLIGQFDNQGHISENNFYRDYNPSYYLRIIWALLSATTTLEKDTPEKIKIAYTNLSVHFKKNYVSNASFHPGDRAYSHTVIYALRGLIECNKYLDNSDNSLVDEFLIHTINLILKNKAFPGCFHPDTKPDYSFICSTGHMQLIICLIQKRNLFTEIELEKAIAILLGPVFKSQRKWGINKGGVPSSIPLYGPYQRFKYTNWTQKFYSDALMAVMSYQEA